MQQYASREGEEEDCWQVNTDVNNAGFKFDFYEEVNAFVGAPGYTQCILVNNTECKHQVCLLTRKLQRPP